MLELTTPKRVGRAVECWRRIARTCPNSRKRTKARLTIFKFAPIHWQIEDRLNGSPRWMGSGDWQFSEFFRRGFSLRRAILNLEFCNLKFQKLSSQISNMNFHVLWG